MVSKLIAIIKTGVTVAQSQTQRGTELRVRNKSLHSGQLISHVSRRFSEGKE